MTALLAEDEPLRKQREEQQEKERREREQDIMDRFFRKFDLTGDSDLLLGYLRMFGSQLSIAEELKWEDDTYTLEPLTTECVNLLKGNRKEKERIINIVHARKERILIPSDEYMRRKFIDLLSAETNEKFVELVLKFNATLSCLAEERFIDKEELVAEEIPSSKVKVVGKEK